jgi:hypothetical protein
LFDPIAACILRAVNWATAPVHARAIEPAKLST